jgi:hypothetical protein
MDARIAGLIGMSRTGLPLGRHSIMNGVAVRITDGYDAEQAERLASAINLAGRLSERGWAKARALADLHFPDQHGLNPLCCWQRATPPGPQTSRTALLELLGDSLPAHLREEAANLAQG